MKGLQRSLQTAPWLLSIISADVADQQSSKGETNTVLPFLDATCPHLSSLTLVGTGWDMVWLRLTFQRALYGAHDYSS